MNYNFSSLEVLTTAAVIKTLERINEKPDLEGALFAKSSYT